MPQPFLGIVVVVAFVAFVVFLVSLDKKANKKFQAKFESEHHIKEAYGDCFISEEGEFVVKLPSGSLAGYKVWKLSDIAYVATYKNNYSVLDAGQKAMKGDYLTPSKKPLKEKAYKEFSVKSGQSVDAVADLIMKYAGHVQRMQGGKVV
ncbi:MAG: hypothetical protein J5546_08795 [Lachnospiraceae bacterium]|nr:hypothetical protein [Lachnospiraceae bacterium]